MEVVRTQLLNRAAIKERIKCHLFCAKAALTHWSFAGDLKIFFEAKTSSLQGIKDVMNVFYAMSSLKVNYSKSEICCCSAPDGKKLILANLLGLKKGRVPVRHLGVSLILVKLKNGDCQPLTNCCNL